MRVQKFWLSDAMTFQWLIARKIWTDVSRVQRYFSVGRSKAQASSKPGPSSATGLMEEARERIFTAKTTVATAAAGDGRIQELSLTLTTEHHEDGTLLNLTCSRPALQLKPIAVILENLNLTIVSFGIDSSGHTGKGKRAHFAQGHFV